jgi:hypothetical protein
VTLQQLSNQNQKFFLIHFLIQCLGLWCTSTIPQVLHIVQLFSKELLQLLEERFLLVEE